jgi:hypothetical protein
MQVENKTTSQQGYLYMQLYYSAAKSFDLMLPYLTAIDEDTKTQFNFAKDHYKKDLLH